QINADPEAEGDGIVSNAIVERNISYNNGIGGTDGAGGASFDFASIRNARIVNNLSYDNQRQGIVLWDDGFSDSYGSKDNLIANNTVVMPSGSSYHAFSIRNGSTGNTVRNNILIHLGSYNDSIAIDPESFAGFTSNYNVVSRFENTAGNLVTLSNWQSQTGQDLQSITATNTVFTTAVFTNFAARDFTLAAGSLALNAGTTVAQVTQDLLGTMRPQGAAYDIGAYETVVATNNPPGAPTIGTASAGVGQVSVTFTAPGSNGGSPITGYTATCGAQSASGTGAPIVVMGLPAGVPVTCTVFATNMNGNGPPSAASNSVTPTGVPGAPTGVGAAAGPGQATVSFAAPANNGGSPITGYTATCGTQSASGPGSPLTVTGLTPGMAVTCTVLATNAIGSGPASTPSAPVTPPTVPGAPTLAALVAGDAQITAQFSAPASDGGSAVSAYTLTCTMLPMGSAGTSGPASPLTLSGLMNGTQYTCSVAATNAIGTGPASTSLMATPSTMAPLALADVTSRRQHGAAGEFELQIDSTVAVTGAVSVEPRLIGGGHRVVFKFNQDVTAVAGASVVNAALQPIGQAAVAFAGKDVVVTISGLLDNQRARVTVTGINGTLDASASIGFFAGDVTRTRALNAADISAVKARSATPVNLQSFRADINASGTIDSADIAAVKSRSGRVLAP
ncbi:MAG: fibronectin type III domain-containing protein, partial [Betaproteobacteria bacterium]|nr:fibronectin type III domain-containing protein [Betaproteobacteria bacterium]